MNKLKLDIGDELKGSFSLSSLNVLFTFQVNCPGCFSHGFPLLEILRSRYGERVNFVALSTAFEDFELNTMDNTRLLVNDGVLVGETRKFFEQHGINLDVKLEYPVLMDKFSAPDEFLQPEVVEAICRTNPNYEFWSTFDKDLLRRKVIGYYQTYPMIAHTFHLNQFRGTPTFVIFNQEYDILDSWFGHKPMEDVTSIIEQWI